MLKNLGVAEGEGFEPSELDPQTLQLQGLRNVSHILYAFLYAFGFAYPYNFFDMDSPVSRVSSPERCEYRAVLAEDCSPSDTFIHCK